MNSSRGFSSVATAILCALYALSLRASDAGATRIDAAVSDSRPLLCKELLSDPYLSNLPAQPKREIADYVESQGILVPRRFQNLREALKSGLNFIIRSEFPREYFEAAGLLESYVVTQDKIIEARRLVETRRYKFNAKDSNFGFVFETKVLAHFLSGSSESNVLNLFKTGSERSIVSYSMLTKVPQANVLNQFGFSYWELLGGINRTVVADSAVAGRYHIFSFDTDRTENKQNYTIYDHEQIAYTGPYELGAAGRTALRTELQGVIALYERVRNLDRFSPQACPVIEMQSVQGRNYFLQYHHTRAFKAAGFTLARPPERDEHVAELVRGATLPEGEIFDVRVTYGHGDSQELVIESGGSDNNNPYAFRELMTRRREIVFLERGVKYVASHAQQGDHHLRKSELFNPRISIATEFENLFSSEKLKNQLKDNQFLLRFKIRVISDGRKAYLKLLDHEWGPLPE